MKTFADLEQLWHRRAAVPAFLLVSDDHGASGLKRRSVIAHEAMGHGCYRRRADFGEWLPSDGWRPGRCYHRTMSSRLATLALATLCSAIHAAPACRVDDAYADFVHRARHAASAGEAEKLQALHDFEAAHASLYTADAIGDVRSQAADRVGLREMAGADGRNADFDAALQRALAKATGDFAKALPDFRCDFVVHIAPTFGRMDGAGRIVAGKPALVLGPPEIASYQTPAQLPVFIAHELFHRYHFSVAGFSDDLAERDLIWRALWAEGLATYASAELNPDRPLADALLLPRDLAERAAPFVPAMARELGASLDVADARVFGIFFESGNSTAKSRDWPARSGYYIGYLVAKRLAQHYSLYELAHLRGPELRTEIGDALASIAAGA